MKGKDYFKVSNGLKNACVELVNIYEECDTSFKGLAGEREKDIEEWNKRFDNVIEEIKCLEEEMIFTFGIYDED